MDANTSVSNAMVGLYEKNSNFAVCALPRNATPISGPFCHANKEATGLSGFSDPFQFGSRADIIIAYALVADRLISNGGIKAVTPSAIYDGLLRLPRFEGVSGHEIVLDRATGDRLAVLWLQQYSRLDSAAVASANASQKIEVQMQIVATFDSTKIPASEGFVLDPRNQVVFSGNTTEVPWDGSVSTAPSATGLSESTAAILFGGLVVLFVLGITGEQWHNSVAIAPDVQTYSATINVELKQGDVRAYLNACVALCAGYGKYRSYLAANMAADFRAIQAKMVQQGRISLDSGVLGAENIPREITRNSLSMVERIGKGNFGQVSNVANDPYAQDKCHRMRRVALHSAPTEIICRPHDDKCTCTHVERPPMPHSFGAEQ